MRNILARISNVDGSQLRKAENVIIFIGDGMGVATTTAARIFKGQKNGRDGCSEKLIWDNFPTVAHVKVYIQNFIHYVFSTSLHILLLLFLYHPMENLFV